MLSEKLKILNMLKEGSITSSEAIELLDAVESSNKKNIDENKVINDSLSSSIENVINDFNKNTRSISEELSDKFGGMDKKLQEVMNVSMEQLTANLKSIQDSLEKIITSITHDLSSSTGTISSKIKEEASALNSLIAEEESKDAGKLNRSMEDMQKNLNNIPINSSFLAENLTGIFAGLMQKNGGTGITSGLYKKEVDIPSSIALKFEALRGNIYLEGYEGDQIEVEVYCQSFHKSTDEILSITDEDSTYCIKPLDLSTPSISLDIKIPKKLFKDISISTSNGKIEVNDISCGCLLCTTSMGKISLSGLACDTIEAHTSEAKVNLSGIKSKKIFATTHNSPISVDGTFCESSDIITTNGSIILELNDNVYSNNEYKLYTENAPISVELSIPLDTGVYIDAYSANGSIGPIEFPDFTYSININQSGNNHITGQTPDFEKAQNSIKVYAKTSNSEISFTEHIL